LDIRRLEVLLKVVEQGSVTAAAEAMTYTPSAVSQQLRRLEHEVGMPLLQRHARGMVPTEAGHVLAVHARKVFRQMAAAESDLRDIAGLRRGSLELGTFPTVGSSFLPLAVKRFGQLYPSIQLNIRSAREAELIEMLEEGLVGLSMLWDYEWGRIQADHLSLTTLFTDPTVLVVATDHPLARRRQVSMAALAAERWIIRSNNHPVVEV
jgi:DNA-binding transcriptional LysR family regulator